MLVTTMPLLLQMKIIHSVYLQQVVTLVQEKQMDQERSLIMMKMAMVIVI